MKVSRRANAGKPAKKSRVEHEPVLYPCKRIFLYIKTITVAKLIKTCSGIGLCVLLVLWILTRQSGPNVTSAIACKNKITKIIFPDPQDEQKYLSNMDTNPHVIEQDYYILVEQLQKQCFDQERIGEEGEGSWHVCMDRQYIISQPCLVYSFGVGEDNFKFEEDLEKKIGCEVHAFDPSIGLQSYQHSEKIYFHNFGIDNEDSMVNGVNWRMRRLSTIMKDLGHEGKTIDLLKLDVEFSEWPALYDMIQSGIAAQVRQIAVETHSPEMDIHTAPEHRCTYTNVETMQFMLKVLLELQQVGFKTYFSTTNYRTAFTSKLTGQQRYCCHNVHLFNTKHEQNVWRKP